MSVNVVQTDQRLSSSHDAAPPNSCGRWGFSPDMMLLLDMVAPADNLDARRRVQAALARGVDWQTLIGLANRHRLKPLLCKRVRERWEGQVPAPVAEHLNAFFRSNALTNLSMVSQMNRTLELLDQAEIAVIPYKGAVLAQRLYGNPAMRSFGDIDLLLHAEDVPRALRLMVDAGYHPVHGLDTYLDATYRRDKREARMLAPHTGALVEIQWRIAAHWEIRQASDGVAEMWQRCQWMTLAGQKLRTFCAEDLFVVLCAHASCHCWQWPSSVSEIAALMSATPDMDWQQVMDVAARLHIRRMILIAVYLAEGMLGQPVPEPLRKAVADDQRALERLGRAVCRSQQGEKGLADNLWQEARMHIALRERPAEKLLYLRHYLAAYVRGVLTGRHGPDE